MTITLTNEEYRDLLHVLHMADWMMHAHETEKDPATEPYDRLIQKLYGMAKSRGLGDLVEYDADARQYFVTNAFADATGSRELIEHFIEETFWDELIHRLTDRDLALKVGGYERLDTLNSKERFTLEAPVMDRYSLEFEERGLDRLEIVEQPVSAPPPVQTHD